MHTCPDCGREHQWPGDLERRCFRCANSSNPFLGIRFGIEVGSEDSDDPRRVADGTAQYNVGLPGVETIVGTRADGKPKIAYRPVTNSEIGTGRARRQYAERHGLQAVEAKTVRAVGR